MKTVLVVDDEALIRWSLGEYLRGSFTVVTAASAEEAMNIISRIPIDALVTDLDLPGRSGLELLDRVREKRPEAALFVITAHVQDALFRHLKDRGVTECYGKPFDLIELRRRLEETLEVQPCRSSG